MEMLDKEFHTYIVERNRTDDRQGIANKLASRFVLRSAECNIAVEPKACKESNRENDDKRGNMWRDNNYLYALSIGYISHP